jgi:hypothetical protein
MGARAARRAAKPGTRTPAGSSQWVDRRDRAGA